MRFALLVCLLLFCPPVTASDDVPRASLQRADIASLPDRTDELVALLARGKGSLVLERGTYRLTRPVEIRLEQRRRTLVSAFDGPVTLIMDGPGPALRLIGSHEGTASPKSFEPDTWNESFPLIEGIEIIGSHPQSVGIELIRCVQPTISRVAIRWCHHGIQISDRNRNVTISDVHLYENSGIGLYLDDVDLHQINVANSHISYNREGGIVVRDGNVRNLQIANCDIEGNMPADDTPTKAANILIDISDSAESPHISIAEIAITGCTIQHASNYTRSDLKEIAPGGANLRILGNENLLIDSVTVHGNVISDTSTLIDIRHAMDVNLTGNTFFAPNPDFVHVRDSRQIILNGNTFNPRQFVRPGRLQFIRSQDCLITNNTFRSLTSPDHSLLIRDCRRIGLSHNLLSDSTRGLRIESSEGIQVKDWIIDGLPENEPFLSIDAASSVIEEGNER